jgi:hypothetical protein
MVSFQDPGHKFGCEAVPLQFFRRTTWHVPKPIPASSAMS